MTVSLTRKQQALLPHLGRQGTRHTLIYGGSRSGKTFLICYAIATRALRADGSRHGVFRKHAVAVKQSVGRDTFPKVMHLAYPEAKYRWYEQDGVFVFANGSEFWCAGLDDKERVDKVLGKEYCLDPEARVLTGDFRWVPAHSVSMGEELVGFQENLDRHIALEPAIVEAVRRRTTRKLRIVTDRGETVISASHKLVCKFDDRRRKSASRFSWRAASDLSVGDVVRFAAEPWAFDDSFETGWVSGMYDGEGWVNVQGRGVAVAQSAGPLLDRLVAWHEKHGIVHRIHNQTSSKNQTRAVARIQSCGLWASMRALGICRPQRLMKPDLWRGCRAFTTNGESHEARILGIEDLGEGDVVSIQTSARTLIADGFLGHNCTIYENEASELSYDAHTTLMTRLAQNVAATVGHPGPLPLRNYVDLNPTTQSHWTYKLFVQGVDPESKRPVDRGGYSYFVANPMDNEINLPPDYLTSLQHLPEAKRRRFFSGEYSGDADDALWSRSIIERFFALDDGDLPEFVRIVVAVDPAASSNPGSDETGIVVAAVDKDGFGYVLEDASGVMKPEEWARRAVTLYHYYKADCIVAEKNNGGEMVESTIQAQRTGGGVIPVKLVHAARGKVTRAEPISALYARRRVRHIREFPELEDQMCSFTTGFDRASAGYSPDRVDALVWAMTELFPGLIEPAGKMPSWNTAVPDEDPLAAW